VDISGWDFLVGVTFGFPTNAITRTCRQGLLGAGEESQQPVPHLYEPEHKQYLRPYTGTLANGGERVLLTAADYDR